MAGLHFRHASVNTALEARPQANDGQATLSPRPRTPIGHGRIHSIGTTEKADPDAQPLLYEEKEIVVPKPKQRTTRAAVLPICWIFSIILTSLITYLSTTQALTKGLGTLVSGYTTELGESVESTINSQWTNCFQKGDARSAIRAKKQQFYGSLDFKDRRGFIPLGSPSEKYVGSTPEVDAAWDELTKDRYFLLTDNEAHEAYGEQIGPYWNVHHGGYIAGLDVLHTLHCLNHLRMSLYRDVYPFDPVDGTTHIAHCVDHLRQLAMCNADLTPVPTQYFEGLGRNYINSSREHTCRDFWTIRDWATERFNGSTAVKPRNRDGKHVQLKIAVYIYAKQASCRRLTQRPLLCTMGS